MDKRNKKEKMVILASVDVMEVSFYQSVAFYRPNLNSPQYMLSISD
jgi:hypothetical protein